MRYFRFGPTPRVLLALCLAVGGTAASAKDLKIVFSQYTPPYVFEDGTGIVVDIVRESLAPAGHTITPVYVPIERGFKMFADRQVDGTTIIQESSGLKAEYSDEFMRYHNYAFTLKARGLSVRTVHDLQGKSVIAFQNASKYLGTDFGRLMAANRKYKEMAQQEAQTHMLLLGRTDVAVMDESIFRYYREKLIAAGKVERNVEYMASDLFPPTPYKAAFNDRALRDQFNRGVAALRKSGRYDAIYRNYTERYFPVRK